MIFVNEYIRFYTTVRSYKNLATIFDVSSSERVINHIFSSDSLTLNVNHFSLIVFLTFYQHHKLNDFRILQ